MGEGEKEGGTTDGRGEEKEGGKEDGKSGGKEEGKEEGRDGGKKGGMKGGKEGGRSEGGREGGIGDDTRQGERKSTTYVITCGRQLCCSHSFIFFCLLLLCFCLSRSVFFACTNSFLPSSIYINEREKGREGGREGGRAG